MSRASSSALRTQAETLLRPYLAALLADPRGQLPVSTAFGAEAAQSVTHGDN